MADKPLTDANRREINAALANLNAVIPHLDLLDRLRVDTSELRQKLNDTRTDLQTIKDHYFPGQP